MSTSARTFTYGVSLDAAGMARSDEGGTGVAHEDEWTPEHLVLAGLGRCTLKSLDYHSRRVGIASKGTARAGGEVTQRTTDGRYAFVRIKVELDVTLDPKPENVRELLAKAERDCFVGASLTAKPRYRWTVNGEEIL